MAPIQRFYDALDGGRLVPAGREMWDGRFGSLDCPSCGERGGLWWGEIEGAFKCGCRSGCGRPELAKEVGLGVHDLLEVRPGWL